MHLRNVFIISLVTSITSDLVINHCIVLLESKLLKFPFTFWPIWSLHSRSEGLRERTEHLDISFFRPSLNGVVSDVLFTGGRGMSDFSVLKYY